MSYSKYQFSPLYHVLCKEVQDVELKNLDITWPLISKTFESVLEKIALTFW